MNYPIIRSKTNTVNIKYRPQDVREKIKSISLQKTNPASQAILLMKRSGVDKLIATTHITAPVLKQMADISSRTELLCSRLINNDAWLFLKGYARFVLTLQKKLESRERISDLIIHSHSIYFYRKNWKISLPSHSDLACSSLNYYHAVVSKYGITKFRQITPAQDCPYDSFGDFSLILSANKAVKQYQDYEKWKSDVNVKIDKKEKLSLIADVIYKDLPYGLRFLTKKVEINYLPWDIFFKISENKDLFNVINEPWFEDGDKV